MTMSPESAAVATNTQDREMGSVDASSNVLARLGLTPSDLFTPGPAYEAVRAMLVKEGVTSDEIDLTVSFAQGIAAKNQSSVDALRAGHQKFMTAANAQSDEDAQARELYSADKKIQAQSEALGKAFSNLFKQPFTTENAYGAMFFSTPFLSSEGKRMSKKKRAVLTTLLLAVTLSACGAEAPSSLGTTILTADNGQEYSVNEARTVSGGPYFGYLLDKSTPAGSDVLKITGPTVNRFQFALAEVQNVKDANDIQHVRTFQQVDENNNASVEYFLVDSGQEDVYKLMDKNGDTNLYSILLINNQLILRVLEDGRMNDYLISDKSTLTSGSAAVPTQSPVQLYTDIDISFKAQNVSYVTAPKIATATQPVQQPTKEVASKTPVPTATEVRASPSPEPTVDPNQPKGEVKTDAKGSYVEVNKVKVRPYEIQSPNENTKIWAFSMSAGEKLIPLHDQGTFQLLLNKILVDQNVPGASTIQLLNHPTQHNPSASATAPEYNLRFPGLFAKSRGTKKEGNGYNIANSKFSFTTNLGTFEWWATTTMDNPKETITTVIRSEQDMPVVKDRTNGVVKYTDPYDSDNFFLMKLYVNPADPDHKLVVEIASHKSLDKLTPLQRAMLVEMGPYFVIAGEDQRNNQYFTDLSDMFKLSIDEAHPFITFIDR